MGRCSTRRGWRGTPSDGSVCVNDLHQIGLAAYIYHEMIGTPPPVRIGPVPQPFTNPAAPQHYALRHGPVFNLLWCDGHAGAMNMSDLQASQFYAN